MNLYEISNKILGIFANAEANDGEITDEEYADLEIAEEELSQKLSDYKRAIRVWEGDINSCKEEEKRIKAARQVKENRIEKLKVRMLEAVQKFGYDGKPNKKGKSNKFYELPDGRIFTKTTESIEFNENRINILTNLLIEACKNEHLFDIVGNPNMYNELLNYINEQVDTYYEGQEHFTMTDLMTAKFEYVAKCSPIDLLLMYSRQIKEIAEDSTFKGLNYDVDKTSLKVLLNSNNKITLAKIKETDSLTIK